MERSAASITGLGSRKASGFSAAAIALAVLSGVAAGSATEWPVSAGGNGHFYEVVSVPAGISWSDASKAAQASGGYLATLESAAENLFVFALTDHPVYWSPQIINSAGPWIGGLQAPRSPEPNQGWEWLDGSAMLYANWAAGEPNNGAGGTFEDRLVYWSNSPGTRAPTWNDLPDSPAGDFVIAYVVEYEPCPADLNGDFAVDAADLAIVLGSWGGAGIGDLNADGIVNAADIAILLGAWGPCAG
jgi:hypothetical protein